MITRRALLAAAAVAPFSAHAALPVPRDDRLTFRVLREGSRIGTHVLTFMRDSDAVTVRIAVDLRIGLGPITLFRYTLRGSERWRNGQIEAMDVVTNDDGTQDFARATRDASGLWVEGSKASRYRAPHDALPASHWNMAELDGPWINPQDGRLFRPVVARQGQDHVAEADGTRVLATRYALSGDVQMKLWYDAAPSWVALDFAAHDGSVIHYERV